MTNGVAESVAQQPDSAKRPFGMRDKIGYMFGDFGNDFTFILQMMFFMLFYTNVVGIQPGHVGLLFLVARLVDGFTDVGMGILVDRLGVRCDLLLGERANGRAQFVVLFRQAKEIEIRVSGHAATLLGLWAARH